MDSLTERLQEARRDAVAAKIALRHAKNEASDFLTWFQSAGCDYDAGGKNVKARELTFAKLLAKDERAHNHEQALRNAEDTHDLAQLELDCVLDEVKAERDQTWAKMADWMSGRTVSGKMGSLERSGEEMLKEQVEAAFRF